MKLISLTSATWIVSSATTLITSLLVMFDEGTPRQRVVLGQAITLLRVFSSFIVQEQQSIIDDEITDLDFSMLENGDLHGLADVASIFEEK